METQTRYDLNTAIATWRSELAAQPNLTAEVRRELETHLRDAITGFQQRGLNDEESFWLACKRVGQPPQLGEEFVKADPVIVWRERVFWMLSCVFLLNVLNGFADFLIWLVPKLAVSERARILYPGLISIIVILVLIGLAKKAHQFPKLARLNNGRLWLASITLTLILTSSIISYYLRVLSRAQLSKMGLPADLYPIWQPVVLNSLYPLFLMALIIWLMPAKNRKTSKRA
jgi:hypothetical protein